MKLRPTLVSTIVGLVVVTALVISVSAGLTILANTRAHIDEARRAAEAAASNGARALFAPAVEIVEELAAAGHRGLLPLESPERFAAQCAERLREHPAFAWIGYGERASGRYAGATRNNAGEVVEYTADPQKNGALPDQVVTAADGSRSPPSVAETAPYLVVTRDWFKLGLSQPGPVWSRFYNFTSGGRGIGVMQRFAAPGEAAPSGVFHVDLRVSGIEAFLSTLHVGRHGAVFLLDRDGNRVASPTGEHVPAAAAAVDKLHYRRGDVAGGPPARIGVAHRTYEVTFVPADTGTKSGLIVAVAIDLGEITDPVIRHAVIAAIVGLLVAGISIWMGVLLSSRIARPVTEIAADLHDVGRFRISRQPAPQSFVREIGELGDAVDRMKASLRSFGHYVPTDIVRTLLAAGREAELGGEVRRLTIHFSDIADFTSISEGMTPDRLVEAIGRYFELMTGALTRHGGTLDKFMGDGIMAFFGAPLDLPDHPRRACLAALEAQRALALKAAETPPGEPVFRARIGLGFGEVLVGNIGTRDRFAYTLLGDEVNLASRLEGLNKVYGTLIMATEALAAAAGDEFEWRRLDRVAVKGRHQGTLVCELLGLEGEVPAEILAARDLYERALAAYFAGEFESAASLFGEAARVHPEDHAAPVMRERAAGLADAPPEGAWTGIHVMHEK